MQQNNTIEDKKQFLMKKLMAKEKWTPDEQKSACHSCNKSFNFLFRRKHHCRSCGQVFCSRCTPPEQALDGSQFGQELEKSIRLCSHCYKKCIDFLGGLQKQENLDITFNEINQQMEYFEDLQILFNEEEINLNQEIPYKDLELTVYEKIQNITDFICNKNNIQGIWPQIIAKYVIQAIKDLKVHFIGQSFIDKMIMDITKLVKIKKIQFQDESKTQYIKGVICRKNLSNRKMKTLYENPKILIIQNSIDYNSIDIMYNNFEQLTKNEKIIMKKYVDQITKYKPDIIFVEKSINKVAQDLLFLKNLGLVYKLKDNSMKKIQKAANCLTIHSLDQIDKYNQDKIVGSCKKIEFVNYSIFNEESIKDEQKDPTLMIMETHRGQAGVSILISGPNLKELIIIKKLFKTVLKLGHHLWLEKDLIYLSNQLISSLKVKNHNDYKTHGDMSMFMDQKIQMDNFIKIEKVSYTKINFVQAEIDNFNDLNTAQQVQSYKTLRNIELSPNKIQHFVRMCDKSIIKSIEFYGCNEDISLGKFIMKRLNTLEELCNTCKRPKYNHSTILYHNNTYILMTVDEKFVIKEEEQKDQSLSQITNKQTSKIKKSSNYYLIETYIDCNQCKEKLTDTLKLNKYLFEYSYGRFLQHLFLSFPQLNKFQGEIDHENSMNNKKCTHKYKNRVFLHQDTLLKFLVDVYQPYSLQNFRYESVEIQEIIKKSDCEFLYNLKENIKYSLEKLCTLFRDIMNQVSEKFKKKQIILQNVSEAKQKYQEFQKLYEVIQKIQNTEDIDNVPSNSFSGIYNAIKIKYGIIEQCYEELQDNVKFLKKKKNVSEAMLGITKLFGRANDVEASNIQKREQVKQEQQQNLEVSEINQSTIEEQKENGLFMQKETQSMKELEDFINQNIKIILPVDDFYDSDKQKFEYIPVHESEPMTYVCWALNSIQYMNDIFYKEEFNKNESFIYQRLQEECEIFEQNFTTLPSKIENKEYQQFIQDKFNKGYNEIQIIIPLQQQAKKHFNNTILTSTILKESIIDNNTINKIESKDMLMVNIFYPVQFQALRSINNISHERFIKCLLTCTLRKLDGGKSLAQFYKSASEHLLVKFIKDSEFIMFKHFILEYFLFMNKNYFREKPSLLAKIFGLYEIKLYNKEVLYCIVMENIMMNMNPNSQVYDLKGSETNRWLNKEKGTLLDTNYIIDRNSEPLPIQKESYIKIDRALHNDCKFLGDMGQIDYSAILIIDHQKCIIRIGIIDYLRQYNLIEKFETNFKKLKNFGNIPTVVPPREYSKRFLEAILQNYLIKVCLEQPIYKNQMNLQQ